MNAVPPHAVPVTLWSILCPRNLEQQQMPVGYDNDLLVKALLHRTANGQHYREINYNHGGLIDIKVYQPPNQGGPEQHVQNDSVIMVWGSVGAFRSLDYSQLHHTTIFTAETPPADDHPNPLSMHDAAQTTIYINTLLYQHFITAQQYFFTHKDLLLPPHLPNPIIMAPTKPTLKIYPPAPFTGAKWCGKCEEYVVGDLFGPRWTRCAFKSCRGGVLSRGIRGKYCSFHGMTCVSCGAFGQTTAQGNAALQTWMNDQCFECAKKNAPRTLCVRGRCNLRGSHTPSVCNKHYGTDVMYCPYCTSISPPLLDADGLARRVMSEKEQYKLDMIEYNRLMAEYRRQESLIQYHPYAVKHYMLKAVCSVNDIVAHDSPQQQPQQPLAPAKMSALVGIVTNVGPTAFTLASVRRDYFLNKKNNNNNNMNNKNNNIDNNTTPIKRLSSTDFISQDISFDRNHPEHAPEVGGVYFVVVVAAAGSDQQEEDHHQVPTAPPPSSLTTTAVTTTAATPEQKHKQQHHQYMHISHHQLIPPNVILSIAATTSSPSTTLTTTSPSPTLTPTLFDHDDCPQHLHDAIHDISHHHYGNVLMQSVIIDVGNDSAPQSPAVKKAMQQQQAEREAAEAAAAAAERQAIAKAKDKAQRTHEKYHFEYIEHPKRVILHYIDLLTTYHHSPSSSPTPPSSTAVETTTATTTTKQSNQQQQPPLSFAPGIVEMIVTTLDEYTAQLNQLSTLNDLQEQAEQEQKEQNEKEEKEKNKQKHEQEQDFQHVLYEYQLYCTEVLAILSTLMTTTIPHEYKYQHSPWLLSRPQPQPQQQQQQQLQKDTGNADNADHDNCENGPFSFINPQLTNPINAVHLTTLTAQHQIDDMRHAQQRLLVMLQQQQLSRRKLGSSLSLPLSPSSSLQLGNCYNNTNNHHRGNTLLDYVLHPTSLTHHHHHHHHHQQHQHQQPEYHPHSEYGSGNHGGQASPSLTPAIAECEASAPRVQLPTPSQTAPPTAFAPIHPDSTPSTKCETSPEQTTTIDSQTAELIALLRFQLATKTEQLEIKDKQLAAKDELHYHQLVVKDQQVLTMQQQLVAKDQQVQVLLTKLCADHE